MLCPREDLLSALVTKTLGERGGGFEVGEEDGLQGAPPLTGRGWLRLAEEVRGENQRSPTVRPLIGIKTALVCTN